MAANKPKKRQLLRNNEYYDTQAIFDGLYQRSQDGDVFTNLMELIVSEQNIMLAYRSIKKNKGSKTKTDRDRYSTLNRTSSLKHVFIVRYADDFKLFCKTRNEAVRLFEGTRLWLKERLWLEISPEKSKIVNLKKQYSEFLGFKLKLRPKSGGWVIKSHMTDKAQEKCRTKIRGAIDLLGKKPDQQSAMRFNATVLGLHQYYKVATNVNLDFDKIAFDVRKRLLCRTKRYRSDNGFRGQAFQEYYGSFKGKVINVAGIALFPVRKISTAPPMCFSQEISSYTEIGRAKIHELQKAVGPYILQQIMENPVQGQSVELNDNRISLYVSQRGKCAISKEPLRVGEMEVHHQIPRASKG